MISTAIRRIRNTNQITAMIGFAAAFGGIAVLGVHVVKRRKKLVSSDGRTVLPNPVPPTRTLLQRVSVGNFETELIQELPATIAQGPWWTDKQTRREHLPTHRRQARLTSGHAGAVHIAIFHTKVDEDTSRRDTFGIDQASVDGGGTRKGRAAVQARRAPLGDLIVVHFTFK